MKTIHDYKTITNDFENSLYITWEITNYCNYSCSYCWPESHSNKNKYPTNFSNIKNFFSNLEKIDIYKNKKISIELFGGEPTLWNGLINFINFFKNFNFVLVSNGYRKPFYWEYFPKISMICLTFHPERSSISHFDEIVDILLQKDQNVIVSFMHLPKYRDLNDTLFRTMSKKRGKLIYVSKIVRDIITNEPIKEYDKKDFEIIKNNNFYNKVNIGDIPGKFVIDGKIQDNFFWKNIQKENKNSWLGWKCYIGSNRLFIRANGDIYKSSCGIGGKIGNIFSDDFYINNKYEICTKNICGCKTDALVRKEF